MLDDPRIQELELYGEGGRAQYDYDTWLDDNYDRLMELYLESSENGDPDSMDQFYDWASGMYDNRDEKECDE